MRPTSIRWCLLALAALTVALVKAEASTVNVGDIEAKCASLIGSYDSESQRIASSIRLLKSSNVKNLVDGRQDRLGCLECKVVPLDRT